jgi:hypothetical protein
MLRVYGSLSVYCVIALASTDSNHTEPRLTSWLRRTNAFLNDEKGGCSRTRVRDSGFHVDLDLWTMWAGWDRPKHEVIPRGRLN